MPIFGGYGVSLRRVQKERFWCYEARYLRCLANAQDGIDNDEDPKVAAMRELREETGVVSAELIAEVPIWLTYDFPPDVREKLAIRWGKEWKGQAQKWKLSSRSLKLTTGSLPCKARGSDMRVHFEEFHRCKLLSSYASLVAAVSQMVNAHESMRCYTIQTSDSPIMKFSNSPVNQNDNGDGGGFPVFTFLSIPFSENLVQELVEMFNLELTLKRLIVMELLAVGYEEKD